VWASIDSWSACEAGVFSGRRQMCLVSNCLVFFLEWAKQINSAAQSTTRLGVGCDKPRHFSLGGATHQHPCDGLAETCYGTLEIVWPTTTSTRRPVPGNALLIFTTWHCSTVLFSIQYVAEFFSSQWRKFSAKFAPNQQVCCQRIRSFTMRK